MTPGVRGCAPAQAGEGRGFSWDSMRATWQKVDPHTAGVLAWSLLCGPVVGLLLRLPAGAWWAVCGYQAGCLVCVWAAGVRPGRRPAWRQLALTAGTCLIAAVMVGILLLARVDRTLIAGAGSALGLRPRADLLWLVLYATVNPCVEEAYWRGALLGPRVRSRVGTRLARAVVLIGFLNHHAVVLAACVGPGAALRMCVPIFIAGALWTLVFERTRSLWWSAASHLGVDTALAALYWMATRR